MTTQEEIKQLKERMTLIEESLGLERSVKYENVPERTPSSFEVACWVSGIAAMMLMIWLGHNGTPFNDAMQISVGSFALCLFVYQAACHGARVVAMAVPFFLSMAILVWWSFIYSKMSYSSLLYSHPIFDTTFGRDQFMLVVMIYLIAITAYLSPWVRDRVKRF